MRRPNILFLLTDDQRHDCLGAAGHPSLDTPHMDRLASEGTRFTRCHIMGGTTGAVSCPSRAMCFSGRNLFHLQNNGGVIPAGDILFGEHFRAQGYVTGGFGKWHNGKDAFHRSFTAGDEIFFGGMADHWRVPIHRFDPTGVYEKNAWPRHGCHSTTIIADATTRFIRDQTADQPWIASVHFLAPHDPRTMPADLLDKHLNNPPELPPNFCEEHPFDNGEMSVRDEMLADMPRRESEVRRQLAEYYAMIEHLDHAIGRILTELDRQGMADDTIVVLGGDNGLAVGQHGLMGKQSCYDHSLRVPLVMRGPGVPAGATRDQLVYLHDVLPTLYDLAGVSTPDTVESQSFIAALQDDAPHREDLYCGYRNLMRTVSRDDGWKLIVSTPRDGEVHEQLFHLPSDPWELTNRIADADVADIAEALRERMRAAGPAIDDPWECAV